MSSSVFYNPYLCRASPGARLQKRVSAGTTFLRIVPRGVMRDGETGLIKHVTNDSPRMFYEDRQYMLSKDMVWPGLLNTHSRVEISGILRFHTYDQAESVLYTESSENVCAKYRHYVVPSGTVIRMFGVTDAGARICVNVFGQRGYFYCEYPDTDGLRDVIHDVAEHVGDPGKTSVEIRRTSKLSIYGYNVSRIEDLHVVFFSDWSIAKKVSRCMLDRGIRLYEMGVDPLTRFLVDHKLPSFGWCGLSRYRVRRHGFASTADVEVDCEVGDVFSIPDDISWPEYRGMSFDIECMSGNGGFPAAENPDDMVIQISCVCYVVGKGDDSLRSVDGKVSVREFHLFTVGPCDPIDDVVVYEFPSEFEMLVGFLTFFRLYGPEFLTGYNINTFDLKYIHTRMVKIYNVSIDGYTKLNSNGRFYVYSPESRSKTFTSALYTKVVITGSIVLDMYPVCVSKTSSQNYKLNTVARLYLGQSKEDMSYKDIPVFFRMSDGGRAKVGKYCVQDAALVRDLFNKISYHYEAAAIARLARIPMRRVIFDGQQIRIYTCILEEAGSRGMVLPNLPKGHDACEVEDSDDSAGARYQGATVFDPSVGYYNTPVAVFDFASLYPSIIMANNLCYTTLLTDDGVCDERDVFVVDMGDGVYHRFVKDGVRRSILAELLSRWLMQRRVVREAMRSCEDPVTKMLMDKQQLALKVTCNAFYGFTGVDSGMMPCLPIAASITRIGRAMLSDTSAYIHSMFGDKCFMSKFFRDDDYMEEGEFRVEVIYGDTDSMFVLFEGVRENALSREVESMARHITATLFKEPVKLEFEKIFASLMMICKKRYIGRIMGSRSLVMKGVDLVRRTTCDFVKDVVRDVLDLVFNDDEVARASVALSKMGMEDLKRTGVPCGFFKILSRLGEARDALHLNSVDVDRLSLSSVLSQDISRYKQKNLPHLAVIRRLASRSEELPSVGDRVLYVLTAPPKGASKNIPNYELAEDPVYVREHKIPINADKYFDHVLKAVTNVMSPVFPKNVDKKDKFLASVMPMRVYVDDAFRPYCRKAEGGEF